jgi:hypothetical protein
VAPLVSQRWEQSLTELQHPTHADSLIPMFEGMVDRAFSRTGNELDHEPSKYLSQQEAPSANLRTEISLPPRLRS